MAVAGPRSQYMLYSLSKYQRPLKQDEICDMSQLDSDLRNHGMNGEYIPLSAEGKSMSSCKLLTDWSDWFLHSRTLRIKTALLEDRPV